MVPVVPMQENDVGFVVVWPFEVVVEVEHPDWGHVVPDSGAYTRRDGGKLVQMEFAPNP